MVDDYEELVPPAVAMEVEVEQLSALDLDFLLSENFLVEPVSRGRANTWSGGFTASPLQHPSTNGIPSSLGIPSSPPLVTVQEDEERSPSEEAGGKVKSGTRRGSCSRKNAWGNASYADLIAEAINSSPEKRLTLNQIYEWVVENVDYFKDKADTNSSAGWKNSIRHNLSLHSCFMREANEATGKSSWWRINPDPRAGKSSSTRGRASSMESSKSMEKKRDRLRTKLKDLRGAGGGVKSPSSSFSIPSSDSQSYSDVSEAVAFIPDQHLRSPSFTCNPSGFLLSPDKGFRERTYSNASSCGGPQSPCFNINECENEGNFGSTGGFTLGHGGGLSFRTELDRELADILEVSVSIKELNSLGLDGGSIVAVDGGQIYQNAVHPPSQPEPQRPCTPNDLSDLNFREMEELCCDLEDALRKEFIVTNNMVNNQPYVQLVGGGNNVVITHH